VADHARFLSGAPAPRTSLDQLAGPDRRLAVIRGSLDLARQAAHRHGAKVNDVLLAITAAGLRGLLRSRANPSRTLPCRSTCPSRCDRRSTASRHAGT
jgi:hypothetical protein